MDEHAIIPIQREERLTVMENQVVRMAASGEEGGVRECQALVTRPSADAHGAARDHKKIHTN